MANLVINGQKVTVDDSFLKLSPDQQHATVDEIAKQMSATAAPAAAPPAGGQAPPPQAAPVAPAPASSGSPLVDAWNNVVDPANAALSNFVQSIPIAGPALAQQGAGFDAGFNRAVGAQAQTPEAVQSEYANDQARYPVASTVGGIAGAVAPFAVGGAIPGVAKVLGMDAAAPLASRVLASAGSNAAITGADALARGQTLDQAKNAAMTGGALGAAGPVVGAGVQKALQGPLDAVTGALQRRATTAAIAGAPAAADLRNAGSTLFQKVDNSGVTVSTPRFSQLVAGLVGNAKKMGIDPGLDPKATIAYQRLIGALHDVQSSGNNLTVSDLHTLRQIAQGAATSTEGRDGMFANQIVKGLDNFIMTPGALSVPGGGNDLMSAMSAWARASRVSRIQDAIAEGSNMASGAENGIRLKLLGLLRDKSFTAQLSGPEKQALSDAANGNLALNSARFAGFFGSKLGASMAGVMGSAAGSAFGAPGSVAGAMAGTGVGLAVGSVAKAAAERARIAAAERAARVLATPNLPQVPHLTAPNLSLLAQAYVRSRALNQ